MAAQQTSMPNRYSTPDKYDNRQRLLPPEYRLTYAVGAALLEAAKMRKRSVWASRAVANRLADLGLAMFVDYKTSGKKYIRIQFLMKLTGAGRAKAKELG